MCKYRTTFFMAWQDSLVYRLNALVWVLYAVLPSATLMLVWIAAYHSNHSDAIGGFSLSQMMTYYLYVTILSVVITPNPEWEIAQLIRDGQMTRFLVQPLNYFLYRTTQETAYQFVKSFMMLPTIGVLIWCFHQFIALPALPLARLGYFLLASGFAYALLSQLKFLLAITAFWFAEPGGFFEIWNVLMGVFAGRLLPLSLLPKWLVTIGDCLPFSSLYAFPLRILMGQATAAELMTGFARQSVWLILLAVTVHITWRRGLLAYEGYGG